MTLGGLALAVGILVDDATVTIENIERHLHLGSDLHKAILDGAGEIAVPALVSTLCICIVFVPMFFLTGVARYLFAPLAEAVVFAMLASYVLSRTLVPTLVMMMMDHAPSGARPPRACCSACTARSTRASRRLRAGYSHHSRARCSSGGACSRALSWAFACSPAAWCSSWGAISFRAWTRGQIRLHMRLPTGTRIEETARVADQVENVIRTHRAGRASSARCSTIWASRSAASTRPTATPALSAAMDGEIQVSLNEGHRPTQRYMEEMRRELPRRFPGVEFFFQPADMVTQILNFGLPSAIDVKVTGADLRADYDIAAKLMKQIEMIPGTVDTHIHQRLDLPTVSLHMDRTQLQQLGLSPNDVTSDLLVSTAGTTQTSPAFWLSPANGVVYNLAVQSPQYAIDSLDALLRTPVRAAGAATTTAPQLLSNLVSVAPAAQEAVDSRFNLAPAIDIYSSAQGRDMGSISRDIRRLVAELRPHLPRGVSVEIRGQARP